LETVNEAEKTVIGHLLRFPDRSLEITEGLSYEDFSSQKLGAIFRACLDHPKGYDVLLISSTLQGWGFDVSVADLISLEEYAFDGVDLSRVKEEIRTESQKRTLSQYLNNSLKELQKSDSDLSEIYDGLSKKLLDIQAGVQTDHLLKRPSDFRDEILNPKGSNAMITGLESFDRLFGGFRSHELTVLTGETSSGKTTFGAAFLPYVIAQNHPVLIGSFEMKPPQIQRKMVQMTTGRPFYELTRGEKELGLDIIESLPLHFIDAYGQIGLKELRGAIFQAHRKFQIKLAILDHLHFFLRYSGDQERQAIDQALRDIKGWAMDLGLHIILIVHPTKLTYDNKIVHLNDLKGSSGLKQIPDNVLSIWRSRDPDDLKKPQSEIVLYILKCRDDEGDEGKIILTFDKRSQTYADSGHGGRSPSEERVNPDSSSPRSSRPSGRDLACGYDS